MLFVICSSLSKSFEFDDVLSSQNYLTLLDDEDHTLESLKIQDEQQLVIEGIKGHISPELRHVPF